MSNVLDNSEKFYELIKGIAKLDFNRYISTNKDYIELDMDLIVSMIEITKELYMYDGLIWLLLHDIAAILHEIDIVKMAPNEYRHLTFKLNKLGSYIKIEHERLWPHRKYFKMWCV